MTRTLGLLTRVLAKIFMAHDNAFAVHTQHHQLPAHMHFLCRWPAPVKLFKVHRQPLRDFLRLTLGNMPARVAGDLLERYLIRTARHRFTHPFA
jgi:hypothetical protein